jgi:hypothetical protein
MQLSVGTEEVSKVRRCRFSHQQNCWRALGDAGCLRLSLGHRLSIWPVVSYAEGHFSGILTSTANPSATSSSR